MPFLYQAGCARAADRRAYPHRAALWRVGNTAQPHRLQEAACIAGAIGAKHKNFPAVFGKALKNLEHPRVWSELKAGFQPLETLSQEENYGQTGLLWRGRLSARANRFGANPNNGILSATPHQLSLPAHPIP